MYVNEYIPIFTKEYRTRVGAGGVYGVLGKSIGMNHTDVTIPNFIKIGFNKNK